MPLPTLLLVSGPEEVLADRAVTFVIHELRDTLPEVEVIRLAASTYEGGQLMLHTSPSLFGGAKAVVIEGFEETTDELQTDLLAYLAAPADDVTLVVTHRSGNRGKKVLDALRKQGARVFEAAAVKTDRDKAEFVNDEFRRAGRKVTPDAVQALVQAIGKDLRELASACSQLVADTEGLVDESVVETYHGGKVEASGFKVADAAVGGDRGEALALLRHAIATGVDPVPIVAVLASQLRQLVRVGSAGRGSSANLARELGMAPWQVDRARRSLQGWDGPGLGRAIQAVATADLEVKGGGRDPVYAVERAVLAITAARGGR
ncbi:MAG: DNA polymerase III subunit delta [Actinomycetota bacterium]|nr:DNA polymerase III subunit delta [Actinomycetota bacterium]